MPTNPEPIMPPNPEISQYEAKNVELISKLLQKTAEGKIQWKRQKSSVTASLPDGLSAEFAVPSSPAITFSFLRGITPENWFNFEIKDEKGNSIVVIKNEGVLVRALRSGPSAVSAAEALYRAVVNLDTAKLKHVIDAIDKM
jgi:hypothetical protein